MGNLARDFLFRMPAKDYTFCLLIVRYMLSDKIKDTRALKARNVLHVVRDKVHAWYWYWLSMHLSVENSADAWYWYWLSMHLSVENSAGYLQRVQTFLKPFIGEIFTYKKHPIHRNSSTMVINMDFLCQ